MPYELSLISEERTLTADQYGCSMNLICDELIMNCNSKMYVLYADCIIMFIAKILTTTKVLNTSKVLTILRIVMDIIMNYIIECRIL